MLRVKCWWKVFFPKVWPSLKWVSFLLLLLLCVQICHIAFYLAWNFREDERSTHDALVDNSESRIILDKSSTIPFIVHQIWISDESGIPPPPRFKKCADTWLRLDSKYKYTLWNDVTLLKFFQQHYPWFVNTWQGYKYTMNRVDTAKYFLLHYFGGLFIDMDICKKMNQSDPISFLQTSLLLKHQRVLLVKGLPLGVNPEVMAAPPRHPFMRHCLRGLHDSNLHYLLSYGYMMCVGGPCFLTGRFAKYPEFIREQQIFLLDYEIGRQKLFDAVHGGSWLSWDSYLLIRGLWFGVIQGELIPLPLTLTITLITLLAFMFRCRRVCRPRSIQTH